MATKPNGGVVIKRSKAAMEDLAAALALMANTEVLVGFPEETTQRQDDTGETDDYGKPMTGHNNPDITNAALGYIHDNGAPEANIPARPFMVPGIEAARGPITSKLAQTANAVLRGDGPLVVEQGLHQVGLIAKLSIQRTISGGVPPPLAESTLRARARKGRKGAGLELLSRQMGYEPSMDFAKPLDDTAQMRNAVNYVIRKKSARR